MPVELSRATRSTASTKYLHRYYIVSPLGFPFRAVADIILYRDIVSNSVSNDNKLSPLARSMSNNERAPYNWTLVQRWACSWKARCRELLRRLFIFPHFYIPRLSYIATTILYNRSPAIYFSVKRRKRRACAAACLNGQLSARKEWSEREGKSARGKKTERSRAAYNAAGNWRSHCIMACFRFPLERERGRQRKRGMTSSVCPFIRVLSAPVYVHTYATHKCSIRISPFPFTIYQLRGLDSLTYYSSSSSILTFFPHMRVYMCSCHIFFPTCKGSLLPVTNISIVRAFFQSCALYSGEKCAVSFFPISFVENASALSWYKGDSIFLHCKQLLLFVILK